MKRVFFFAVLASVAFAGCTFDEGVSDGAVNGNEINFAVAQYTPQTRAEEHDAGVEFTNQIKVWSWYTDKATPVINGDVYNTSSPEGFESGNKYYWPADGTHLDFVAVPNDCVTKYVTAPTRTGGATELEFSINGTDYHADNLMTTEVIKDQTAPDGGTIALIFRHLLSKVNINVSQKVRENEGARWLVTVNDIKVEGLKNTGKVVINNSWDAEGGDARDDKFWNTTSGSETWQVTDGDEPLYASIDPAAIATPYASAETYYMLPQKFEDNTQKITIDYTIETEYLNGVQPNTTEAYEQTIYLKDVTNINKWAMNKIITYNIFIDPSSTLTPITFNVNEEEWGVGSGDKNI